jgi:4-hydroxy-4-methyl-2-oxoglutarate aldolase
MTGALDQATSDRLLRLGTATLYEASGIDCDLDIAIRPAWPGARLCGLALPVRTGPEDNLALHLALEQVQPGDVLVADGGGQRCGYWGEILAVAAQMRGALGLVIDGGVRDVDRLAELGFPAFSRYIAVRRTVKLVPGTIGEPIDVGGRPVARGDIVVADVDGVIVLPRDRLTGVTEAAIVREEKETHFLERIRAGESTVDLFGLR